MKRVLVFIPVLLLPALVVAQTPAKPRRATHVRGEAVGLDNRPVTPATSAARATPATHTGDGPATPATPATPASPSHRPDHAGLGGQGRSNNPRRP